MSIPVTRASALHYTWASVCDGWRLVDEADLSVIEERVPSGAGEKRHYHERARQFFYVLCGAAVVEVEGSEHLLAAGFGLEVAPRAKHKLMNRSDQEVVFLVVSAPSTRGDRVEVE